MRHPPCTIFTRSKFAAIHNHTSFPKYLVRTLQIEMGPDMVSSRRHEENRLTIFVYWVYPRKRPFGVKCAEVVEVLAQDDARSNANCSAVAYHYASQYIKEMRRSH